MLRLLLSKYFLRFLINYTKNYKLFFVYLRELIQKNLSMKKFTFLLVGLLISLSAFSQNQRSTEIFNEDFSSGVPPTGWTIDDMAAQWSQESSANAGGTAPEAQLSWVSGTHTTRLISPETDLTGVSTVLFSFKHFLNDYSGSGYTIGVATRSGGGGWTDAWTVNPSGDIGPETKDLVITGGDVGASDFQVCVYLSGNMYNFDYWYIDDLILTQPDANDVALESINVPSYAEAGDVDIKCTFKNVGLSNVTSVDVNYQIDGGTTITETVGGLNLQTADNHNYTFATPWTASAGDYTLDVWVSNINSSGDDDDTSNDAKSMSLSIATQSTQNLPLFESFTSSTCGPCAPFNTNVFNPFMEAHPDDIAVIKYQMSWPAPGDPYYTAEGGVRRGYYGVSFVPDLYTGGAQTATNVGGVNAAFNTESAKAAFFNMLTTLDIDGDNVNVAVNITPYISVDMRVHIAVLEKETTGNVGNNGETSFENVMMKMLPDADGTLVSFEAGTDTVINESYDMSSTNVEEMDDLLVVVFIQDDSTKQIMQASYNGQPLGLNDNNLQNIGFYPNPSNGYLNITTDEALQVTIHDVLGKKVFSNNVSNEVLDLTHLNNGMYLVNITDGVSQTTKKLIINK